MSTLRRFCEKLHIGEDGFHGHHQVAATAWKDGMYRSLLTIWRWLYPNRVPRSFYAISFTPMTLTKVPARSMRRRCCKARPNDCP